MNGGCYVLINYGQGVVLFWWYWCWGVAAVDFWNGAFEDPGYGAPVFFSCVCYALQVHLFAECLCVGECVVECLLEAFDFFFGILFSLCVPEVVGFTADACGVTGVVDG